MAITIMNTRLTKNPGLLTLSNNVPVIAKSMSIKGTHTLMESFIVLAINLRNDNRMNIQLYSKD